MLEITNLARGAVIGVGLAWLLERWVMNLFDQVSAADPEEFPQNTVENSSKLFSRWRIFAGMSIATAALCVWRQWSPELFSDLILVTALVGIGTTFGMAFIFCASRNAEFSDWIVSRRRTSLFRRFFVRNFLPSSRFR